VPVADAVSLGPLREIDLVGVEVIRRRITAIDRLGPRPVSPLVTTMWGLLDQIPELIPRARRITAAD
jgi:hypothetical protein